MKYEIRAVMEAYQGGVITTSSVLIGVLLGSIGGEPLAT